MAAKKYPHLGFRDDVAAETIRRLDADLDRFETDHASMIGSILRAAWFDTIATTFLKTHPDGLCVSLGSGLDARAQRIGLPEYPEADWVDIDFPDVAALRQSVLLGLPRLHLIAHDITNLDWVDKTPWSAERPVLILSEGVFMYLEADKGEYLVAALGQAANRKSSEMHLAFDYASPAMVRFSSKHPTVSKTDARFKWGLKSPKALRALDPQLDLIEHTDIMAKSGLQATMMKYIYAVLTGGRRFYGMAHFRRPAPAGS